MYIYIYERVRKYLTKSINQESWGAPYHFPSSAFKLCWSGTLGIPVSLYVFVLIFGAFIAPAVNGLRKSIYRIFELAHIYIYIWQFLFCSVSQSPTPVKNT